jgi:hypothetical protein
MKLETHKEKLKYIREAILCISIATLVGLVVYQIFLYFKIAIFGWNLGLIFAPLTAGYVETIIARRIIGEDIGAISAFILFAYTTFYSFILKNSSLGFNLITIGSIAVILQSAFPTLVNYIIFTVGLGTILYILGTFKKITGFIYTKLKTFTYKHILKKPLKKKHVKKFEFDEDRSNKILNNLDFYFITSTDTNKKIINLGQFHSTVIVEKAAIKTPPKPKEFEEETLYNLKKGKDECLIKLVRRIKAAGGNGIIDLDIQYSLIGIGGESYQITALGMGVYLN